MKLSGIAGTSAYNQAKTDLHNLPSDFDRVAIIEEATEFERYNIIGHAAKSASNNLRLIKTLAQMYDTDWQEWANAFLAWGTLTIDDLFPDGLNNPSNQEELEDSVIEYAKPYVWHVDEHAAQVRLERGAGDPAVEGVPYKFHLISYTPDPPDEWIKGYFRWKGFNA